MPETEDSGQGSSSDSVPPEVPEGTNQEDRKETLDDFRINPDSLSDSVSGQSDDPNKDPDRNDTTKSEVKDAEPVLGTHTEQRIDKFLLKISNNYALRSCSDKNKVSEDTIQDLDIGKNTVTVVNKHLKFKWWDSPEANLALGALGLSCAVIVNRMIDSYEKGKIDWAALNKFFELIGIDKDELNIKEPDGVTQ